MLEFIIFNQQGIFYLFLAILSAFFVKMTDLQVDDNKKFFFREFKFITALAYGSLFGYLIHADARFGAIIIGIILANAIGKKFDDISHLLAIAPLILMPFLLGMPNLNFIILAVFFISAFFDEKMHDSIEKPKKKHKLFIILSKYRLFSWIMAFFVSFLLKDYIYIIALVTFDIAYKLTEYIFSRN
ncbi:MAG: hypothetical protein AABW72_05300 [archaeon]